MPRPCTGSFRATLLSVVLGSVSALCVAGCGMGTAAAPNPVEVTVNGRVHGGQQPVAGAEIQLYVAGNAGNGSAATPLLTTAVTSGADGSFSITGDYSCPSPTSQVYLVAEQGNPGLGAGGNNPALAMMAALGDCGDLQPSQFIWVNEVTTVAAAWTLAPFVKDIADIGSSATNYNGAAVNGASTQSGLANAFVNAQLIVDTTNGTVATLAGNLATEPGKIYALADAMAACVNSDGADSPGCSALFSAATPPGGTAPTNTWDAVVDIVKNPGNNVGAVFAAIGATPPFATTLTQAPNDWTLSLTVTGGGLSSPESLGVDSQGNVWVADYNSLLSAFNPQGTPLSASGYGGNLLNEDYGLAIDPNDNVWVTLEEYPQYGCNPNCTRGSVAEFAGVSSGGALGTYTWFANDSINFPYAVAADSNGTILIANYGVIDNSVNLVELTPSTSTYTQVSVSSVIGFPVGLAPDTAHGVWIAGTDVNRASVAHVDASGTVTFSTDCCGAVAWVALDSAGDVWMADYGNSDADGDPGGSVTELGPDGTILNAFITAGGIRNPQHVMVDAAQNVWVANLHSADTSMKYQSFSEIAGSGSSSPGAAISPSTGYGLDAHLLLPFALAVDPSGDVWVSNTGANSVVMFFGMAAPTKTPMPVTPEAP